MGLDMYAYAVEDHPMATALSIPKGAEAVEIQYWRKHHDLHGWMQKLYISKGGTGQFNCTPVQLTEEDLNNLHCAIESSHLPQTRGFFFGNNPPDEDSNSEDLAFIEKARTAIRNGKKVYYDSWW
jgi:hypothetical protein